MTFRGERIRLTQFSQSNEPSLSGRDRSQHALHSDNLDHALHVVSQNRQADLCSDLRKRLREQWRRTQPRLERAEHVLYGLLSQDSDLWPSVEAELHRLKYVFVLPSTNASVVGRRASGTHRAVGTGLRPVFVQFQSVLFGGKKRWMANSPAGH